MAQFPMLYGTATNGKVKQWSIEVIETVDGGIIRVQHGYEGGKIQTTEKTITQGKNIGKSNATTPLQQAIAEAQSAFQKKKEEKYVTRDKKKKHAPIETDEQVPASALAAVAAVADDGKKRTTVNESVPSPMLAHDYNKRGKSIMYPCFIQPKLDGTRMVAMPHQGLFSRNRKAYPHLEHIMSEINQLPQHVILDGELYSSACTFQEIISLVKNTERQEKQDQIQFHVYDMISDLSFDARYHTLQEIFSKHAFRHLILTKTEQCASESAMKEKHNEYVAKGFEGIMLRNMKGPYANHRSIHLQKYKEFLDTECEIVGYKEGDGQEKGCVIWICTIDGKEFACRPRGSREERQKMYEVGDTYVGKMLTVRYQEKTDDGLLRFPVGIAIRDYE
jgi:ATP-dependent DNA ligase